MQKNFTITLYITASTVEIQDFDLWTFHLWENQIIWAKRRLFKKQHTSTFFTNIRFDKPPVSDAGSVLDHKHLRPGLDVGRAARAEVEVKPGRQESAKCCPMAKTSSPGKVHLPEVFSIVHVEEIIEVSCPAKRKDDSFTIQRETWQHLVIGTLVMISCFC